MDMILLDWTRMGRSYCLAGAAMDKGDWRIVRPLPMKHRAAPVRNVGWSPFLFDGHARWEIFELIGAEPAAPEPPHVEDLWVRALRPRRQSASPEQRRAILAATMARPDEPIFGAPFVTTRTAAYLRPGTGQRSLATVKALSRLITFTGARRAGAPEPDIRTSLPLPGLDDRLLPVKDHHLLARCEAEARSLDEQLQRLTHAVRQMGEEVAVRLGLSRAFTGEPGQSAACWLMADGFFSFTDPQP